MMLAGRQERACSLDQSNRRAGKAQQGSGRDSSGSELIPAWSIAHSTAHPRMVDLLIRNGLDQGTPVAINFEATFFPRCADHSCIIST